MVFSHILTYFAYERYSMSLWFEKSVIKSGESIEKWSIFFNVINPLPPSDAVRKQKKNILEDLFSSVLS